MIEIDDIKVPVKRRGILKKLNTLPPKNIHIDSEESSEDDHQKALFLSQRIAFPHKDEKNDQIED
jgi:hypothetical protein